MIETISVYRTPDGKTFDTEQRARDHMAFTLLHKTFPTAMVEKLMRNSGIVFEAFRLLRPQDFVRK